MARTVPATLQTDLDKTGQKLVSVYQVQWGSTLATQFYSYWALTAASFGQDTDRKLLEGATITSKLDPPRIGAFVEARITVNDETLEHLANARNFQTQTRDFKVFRTTVAAGWSNRVRVFNGRIAGVHVHERGTYTVQGTSLHEMIDVGVSIVITDKRFPNSKPEDDFV